MIALAAFLSTTLKCALVFVLWREGRPYLSRMIACVELWLSDDDASLSAPTGDPADLVKLPPDIEQLASGESEPWARESVRERARELYRMCHGDWDQAKQILFAERRSTIFGTDGGGRA